MRTRSHLTCTLILSLATISSAIAWQTQPSNSTDASGHNRISTYDSSGEIVSVADERGNVTHPGRRKPGAHPAANTSTLPLSTARTSSGIIIHVPADQPTIQAGINAANNGDTVLVSDGTYTENINFMGKAITVTSVNGAAATIIDGGAVDTVVTFSTGEGAGSVLNGFTIQNGFANFNKPSFGDGGGIFIHSASPVVTNNTITANQGCEGVGIYIGFGAPLIQNNLISGNSQSGCSGGIGGGGIAIDGESSGAQVIGNTIQDNSMLDSGVGGGGLSLFAAGAPLIQNNVFSRNNSGSFAGGGIALANNSSEHIVQNLFIHNTAGQGAAISWTIPTSSPGLLLLNNTMAENSSANGSAIFDGGFDTNMTLENNLMIGATGQTAYFCNQLNGSTTPAVFANNDVFSSGTTAITGNCTISTGTNGNISSDPLFIDSALDNFRLQPASPAIDVGSNNTAVPLPATDFDANPRVFNNIVDIGAFEFQTTTTAFSSTSITFPPIPPGTTSAPQTVTIVNTGSIALQVAPLTIGGDFSESDNCPSAQGIAAGQGCTITISFTPTAPGVRTGEITVISNSAAGVTTIQLSGTGAVPAAGLSSTSLNFGNQTLNTSSGPQIVTLTNTGNASLTISGIAASGDFTQNNNCPALLSPGANCNISVTFTPTALGTRSGALTISDNAANSPQSVGLTGFGVVAIAQLSTNSLSFGALPLTNSLTQNVVLSSTGNIALSITGITITGTNSGDFAQVNNCGASLAPGSNCTISISFAPTAAGSRSASLAISDNAGGSPQLVSLTGTGTDFSISGSPSTLNVSKRGSVSSTVTVSPISGFNQSVGLSCSGKPAGTTCSFSPGSLNLSNSLPATAQLTITTSNNTPKGTFTITVTGADGTLAHSTVITLKVN